MISPTTVRQMNPTLAAKLVMICDYPDHRFPGWCKTNLLNLHPPTFRMIGQNRHSATASNELLYSLLSQRRNCHGWLQSNSFHFFPVPLPLLVRMTSYTSTVCTLSV